MINLPMHPAAAWHASRTSLTSCVSIARPSAATSHGSPRPARRRWLWPIHASGASGLGPVGPAALHQRASASAGAFVGEPAEVADMIAPFLDAGVEHLIVGLAAGAGPESIGIAVKTLAPLLRPCNS
jgi:alkanesulfonate monooxygenase SsuD/methylene tetrahydromethanopterin reductase-like flavin-dependent oxidoreductase (luciferase family)